MLSTDKESIRRPRTIHEFADAIGVSATTISRTLSGRGRVSSETRKMILSRMEELGYTPNATAQRLVAGRTQTVLFECGVIPVSADMFMLGLIRGAQHALHLRRYGMLLSSPNYDPVGTVISEAVDGAILIADDHVAGDVRIEDDVTLHMAQQIADRGRQCVVIGHRPYLDSRTGSVVLDLGSGVRELARYLVGLGHRRIGFIGARAADSVVHAFRDELEKLGAPLAPECVVTPGSTPEHGEQGMAALIRLPEPPTVVFARNDTLASGALRAARNLGVRIPQEMGLVGHDDVPFAALMDPPLTTICVDCSRLGQAAAETLLEMLDDPGTAPPPRIVPTSLVIRETVAGLNPA